MFEQYHLNTNHQSFREQCNHLFQSTQTQPLSSTNFLQELDRVTKEIVSAILAEQKAGAAVEGDEIAVPGTDRKFALSHRVTLAELGRCPSLLLISLQNRIKTVYLNLQIKKQFNTRFYILHAWPLG